MHIFLTVQSCFFFIFPCFIMRLLIQQHFELHLFTTRLSFKSVKCGNSGAKKILLIVDHASRKYARGFVEFFARYFRRGEGRKEKEI